MQDLTPLLNVVEGGIVAMQDLTPLLPSRAWGQFVTGKFQDEMARQIAEHYRDAND